MQIEKILNFTGYEYRIDFETNRFELLIVDYFYVSSTNYNQSIDVNTSDIWNNDTNFTYHVIPVHVLYSYQVNSDDLYNMESILLGLTIYNSKITLWNNYDTATIGNLTIEQGCIGLHFNDLGTNNNVTINSFSFDTGITTNLICDINSNNNNNSNNDSDIGWQFCYDKMFNGSNSSTDIDTTKICEFSVRSDFFMGIDTSVTLEDYAMIRLRFKMRNMESDELIGLKNNITMTALVGVVFKVGLSVNVSLGDDNYTDYEYKYNYIAADLGIDEDENYFVDLFSMVDGEYSSHVCCIIYISFFLCLSFLRLLFVFCVLF